MPGNLSDHSKPKVLCNTKIHDVHCMLLPIQICPHTSPSPVSTHHCFRARSSIYVSIYLSIYEDFYLKNKVS